MLSSSPFIPIVAACLALSGVGVFVLVVSSNATLKRRLLPVVLVLFYGAASLIVWQNDGIGGGALGRMGVIALVLAGGVWMYTQIVFCVDCGAMMRRSGEFEERCGNCIARRRTLQ